jgi:hypothetical protein
MSTQERTQVFISYSHEDAEWLRRLVFTGSTIRDHIIAVWDGPSLKMEPCSDCTNGYVTE